MWASNPYLIRLKILIFGKDIEVYRGQYLKHIVHRNFYTPHKCVMCLKIKSCKYWHFADLSRPIKYFDRLPKSFICNEACLNVLILKNIGMGR